MNNLYDAHKILTFLSICLIAIALLWVKKDFIEYETAAFEFLKDRPEGAVLKFIAMLQFIGMPFVFLWKFLVVAFVLWVGCFLFGYRVTFNQCWSVAMAAEFIFFIPSLIEIFWFLFIKPDPSLYEVRSFYPLSLASLFDLSSVPGRFAYPLRAVNLFEVFYIFILTDGIQHFSRGKRKAMRRIVIFSYLLLFIFWLCFYMIVYK